MNNVHTKKEGELKIETQFRSLFIHLIDPQSRFSRKGLTESMIFAYGTPRFVCFKCLCKLDSVAL